MVLDARMECYACISAVFDTLHLNPPATVDETELKNLREQVIFAV